MALTKQQLNSYINKRTEDFFKQGDLTMHGIYKRMFVDNKKGIAFEFYNKNKKYCKRSFKTVKNNISRYASVISELLKDKEKHLPVVFKCQNTPEWCEIFYAILMAGFKPLLVNTKISKEGVNNLAKQAKAVAAITDVACDYDVKNIVIDDLVNSKAVAGFKEDWDDEVIFCSSGTTGDVKMMVYNGENLSHQVACALDMALLTKDIMYPKKYGDIKILAMIPFYHIFGFVAVFLWYSFYGSTIVFPPSMNSKEIQELCSKHHITHVFSVPLFFDSLALQFSRQMELAKEPIKGYLEKLLKMNLEGTAKLKKIIVKKIQQKLLGPDIRMCISGGGFLSDQTARIVNGVGYPLYNGFGMTEIGVTSVELNPILRIRLLCTIGQPLHGITYKIANNEKRGELLVKSKSMHSKEIVGGVIKEAALDEEGFFHTGDIVEMDEEGNYFIKGRIKDVIINADGENIFPDELELYFKDVPNLINYTILGIKSNDKEHKELVTFVGQVASDDKDVKEGILAQINEISKHLPNGVKIESIYFTTNPLPIANNIKVKRHEIKEAIESGSNLYVSTGNKAEKKEIIFDDETMKNILIPIKKMFAEVLVLPEEKINNDSHWLFDLGGDSMNYFDLIAKVNEKFGIVIPDERYVTLACVNDFVEYILETRK